MRFSSSGVLALALALSLGVGSARTTPGSAIAMGPEGMGFYVPPVPLPAGRHGDLIWARPAKAEISLPSAASNWLVLYQSLSIEGKPVAVSGLVSIPVGTPPTGGWPLITWTHGTTGIAPQCAPSLVTPQSSEYYSVGPSRDRLDHYVKQGYAVVFSDFQGLGVSMGIHPFLQGEAEAHGALDIMRAARQIDSAIGSRYVVMGHSQGGQADLFTAHFGPAYVPDLDLLGNIAFAPANDMGGRIKEMTGADQPSLALVYAMYFLESVASNHRGVDLSRILSSTALAHLPQLRTECVTQSLTKGYWATAIPAKQFLPGADLSEVLASAAENDPGIVKISAPTLVMQGGADVTVLPRTTDALVMKLCALGNELTYQTYPTADHEAVVVQGEADAQAWVQARFGGKPATSNCANLPSAIK